MKYLCWRKNLILDKELDVFKQKIKEAMVPDKDEWTDGFNTGLNWALRILNKDKSAY